jgi:hypothetical protein
VNRSVPERYASFDQSRNLDQRERFWRCRLKGFGFVFQSYHRSGVGEQIVLKSCSAHRGGITPKNRPSLRSSWASLVADFT